MVIVTAITIIIFSTELTELTVMKSELKPLKENASSRPSPPLKRAVSTETS